MKLNELTNTVLDETVYSIYHAKRYRKPSNGKIRNVIHAACFDIDWIHDEPDVSADLSHLYFNSMIGQMNVRLKGDFPIKMSARNIPMRQAGSTLVKICIRVLDYYIDEIAENEQEAFNFILNQWVNDLTRRSLNISIPSSKNWEISRRFGNANITYSYSDKRLKIKSNYISTSFIREFIIPENLGEDCCRRLINEKNISYAFNFLFGKIFQFEPESEKEVI